MMDTRILAAPEGAASAAHFLRLAPDEHATVLEVYDDANAAPVLSSQVRIELAAHSRLVHLRIVSPRHAGEIADSVIADVDEDARYEQYTLLAPAAALRSTQALRLAGPRAHASLRSGIVARERGGADLRVEMTHLADDTSSEQHVHALGAGGRTVVDSEVVVPAGRRAIRSRQALRGLHVTGAQDLALRPRMAVRSEGVDCRHGATTCAVAPEQLYFLRSRGIAEAEALRLLAHAHLLQVLAPSTGGGLLRSHLDAALAGIAA